MKTIIIQRNRMQLFSICMLCLLIFSACDPQRDDDGNLGPSPAVPTFSFEVLATDSNRVVIRDLSDGNFQRLWNLPGGIPKTSSKAVDTIFYSDEGVYTISLYVSKADGNGTASSSQQVTILRDAPMECSPKLGLLTGGCGALGKCWRFTTVGGAVKVGPQYGDFSWYTSPENGLQDAQYDDTYCFFFDDFIFEYRNNGQTVNPWNGYAAEDYDPPLGDFQFLEGTGTGGRDQIIIPNANFMGVRDADNVMDVVSLTETELIVRARLAMQNGEPAAEGWFELVFVAE